MSLVSNIDSKLEPYFQQAPSLTKKARKSLVEYWPWLALIFGALQLIAAYALWHVISIARLENSFIKQIYEGRSQFSGFDRLVIYLGVTVLVVEGVLLLTAFSKLKAKRHAGWDLAFLAGLLNVCYALLSLLIRGRGVVSFLFNIVTAVIIFWLLYQVKDEFVSKV